MLQPIAAQDMPLPAHLLTYQDVAEVLAVSRWTVKRMVEAGELPVVRFHRSVRVRAEDVARFIDKRTVVRPINGPKSGALPRPP